MEGSLVNTRQSLAGFTPGPGLCHHWHSASSKEIGTLAKLTTEQGTPRAWQRMLSGRRLDLLDPSPFDIEISDIAHGLARVARWNGQTRGDYPYSVAQHSILVLELYKALNPKADQQTLLQVLLHDAPEYVIGDMISPVKAVIGTAYTEIEDRLQVAIHARFGLPGTIDPRLKKKIKTADLISAYYEAIELAGFAEAEAAKFFGKPKVVCPLDMSPLPTPSVERDFLAAFQSLAT